MTVWDFCAQTEKIKTNCQETENLEEDRISEILSCLNKTRSMFKFVAPHDEHHTHSLKINHPNSQCIPVLVGSIPWQDRQEAYAKYCRLMLILFKAWQRAFDLWKPNESWPTAFENFRCSTLCPAEFKHIMDNMQLLHECKDSHDNHLSERQVWHQQFQLAQETTGGTSHTMDDILENINETEILEHLESIDNCYSEWKSAMNMNTLDCIEHAEDAGLFNANSSDPHYKRTNVDPVYTEFVHSNLVNLENIWKAEYDH